MSGLRDLGMRLAVVLTPFLVLSSPAMAQDKVLARASAEPVPAVQKTTPAKPAAQPAKKIATTSSPSKAAVKPPAPAKRVARKVVKPRYPTYGNPAEGDDPSRDDPVVRAAAVEALGKMMGAVVVVDPASGRVLSVVNQQLAFGGGYQPCSAFKPAVALAVGVVVGGVLQVLVQIPALLRRGMPLGFKLGFRHPGIRRVAALMLPAFAGVGIYQVNVLVSTIFASQQEGWISALYYADRIMEVVLGGYAISVATVVLPVLSQQAVEKKFAAMRETLTFSLRIVAFIVVPGAVGLIAVGDPIVRLLFEHKAFGADSTGLTAGALLFYALGLPAFASVRLMVQGFYATEDTTTPVRIAALALVANVVLCFLLVGPLRQGGLALATSLASYLNLVVLYWVFRRRLGGVDEGRLALSVGRTLAAAVGMGLACWWLAGKLNLMEVSSFARLAGGCLGTIALGAAVYLGLAWVLRAEELGEVYTLVTGRRWKKKLANAPVAMPFTSKNE